MIKRIWIAAIGAVGIALLGLAVASAAISDIYLTDHNLGTAGSPTCMICHTPHNAEGDYLFARPPKDGLTGLGALCFSCHDGTETDVGAFILDPTIVSHPIMAGVEGQDCDRCHDPHEDTWKFVGEASIPEGYRNANVCGACHGTGAISHPVDADADDMPIDRVWDPYASPSDFSGTRLFDAAGDNVVLSPYPGYIKCATCHAAHGAIDNGDRMNTMLYVDPDSSGSPLCDNCHH